MPLGAVAKAAKFIIVLFRLHATLILKAGAEANPPEPLAAVLAEGCQLL